MKNLNLLIKLQNYYITLENSKKVLKDGSYIYFLKKLKEKFEENKGAYKLKEKELENIKRNYKSISLKIKGENKNIEEKEYILYNEAGSNIKLIEELQRDIEKSKNSIKKLEDLSIHLIENDEKITGGKDQLREQLKIIKVNFDEYKKTSSEKINESKMQIQSCEKSIKSIRAMIDKELLEKFDNIRKIKKIAVVPIEKGVCTGCRMRTSSITVDNMRKNDEIVYCDNCKRILYKNKEKNTKKVK